MKYVRMVEGGVRVGSLMYVFVRSLMNVGHSGPSVSEHSSRR